MYSGQNKQLDFCISTIDTQACTAGKTNSPRDAYNGFMREQTSGFFGQQPSVCFYGNVNVTAWGIQCLLYSLNMVTCVRGQVGNCPGLAQSG